MIPFEIDEPRHVNLDDRAFPRFFPRMAIPDVVFEQLDVIFANGRCKQLAESRAARLFVIADFCRRPAFRLSAAQIGTPFKPNQTSSSIRHCETREACIELGPPGVKRCRRNVRCCGCTGKHLEGMRRHISRRKGRSPDFPPNVTQWSEHGCDWLTTGPTATDSWKLGRACPLCNFSLIHRGK